MKRVFALILTIALLVTQAVCFAEAAETPATDELLATVNGDEIYSSDIELYEEQLLQYYGNYGIDTSDETIAKTIRALAMNTAIEMKLLYQKAEETGIAAAVEAERAELEAAAKDEWEAIVAQYETAMAGITDESTEEQKNAARLQVLSLLESYGYTESVYVGEAIDNAIYERMQATMVEGIEVTEDEINASFADKVESDRQLYEGNVAMYEFYTTYYGQESLYVPEGYRGIIHILLKPDDALLNDYTSKKSAYDEQQNANNVTETPDDADAQSEDPAEPVTEEQVNAAKQAILDSLQGKIDEIMSKFNAGTAFSDLIAEYGEDPGMKSEPYMSEGYSVHQDSINWDKDFTAGAMTLEKVGDISEPVVSSFGVHILYYLRDVPGGAVELTDAIATSIREELQSTKESDTANQTMSQWVNEAEIVYTDAGSALRSLVYNDANEE